MYIKAMREDLACLHYTILKKSQLYSIIHYAIIG